MEDKNELKHRIKLMIVENLMLQITADEIQDGQKLFGKGSLGLDSVDALQLVVGIEVHFGLKIADQAAARRTLESVNSIAEAIERGPLKRAGDASPAGAVKPNG